MKIKTDFVTNSSSTSFIMQCASSAKTIGDFISAYSSWREAYIERMENTVGFQEPPTLTNDMVHIKDEKFIVTVFVPIHSGEQDTPKYVQGLSNKESDTYRLAVKEGITVMDVDRKDLNKPGDI